MADRGAGSSAPLAPYPKYLLKRRRFDLYATFLPGGIGNIMFEYASALGLSLHHNLSLAVSLPDATSLADFKSLITTFELRVLPVAVKRLVPAFAEPCDEPGWGMYDNRTDDPGFFRNRSVALYGYRQSWRYFNDYADAVRLAFHFRPELRRAAANYLTAAAATAAAASSSEGRPRRPPLFVGVHVRRGDMLSRPWLYTVAPASYVLEAMDWYEAKYGQEHDIVYVVATNDRRWSTAALARRLLPQRRRPLHNGDAATTVVYTSFDAALDLAVLSACNHTIVTIGTFGWWAGWLAGGDVLYYRGFIKPSSGLYSTYREADYYPPWWIGLG